MKLKQQPEDFHVEEVPLAGPSAAGPFALYRLEKQGWTTHDALQVVRRRWHIDWRRLSYGGLKDRHAHTVQFFTLLHGPRRNLHQQGIDVRYLGQAAEPYTSRQVEANRFRLTLRGLDAAEVTAAAHALDAVRRDGVPNYFDDQRFGSVGADGRWIARLMIDERYEEALQLALAGPYEHDRAEQKREKAILRAHWGDWAACKDRLPRGHARSLVDYLLHHPGDFRGALARLRPELRGLYLSAYQSFLWNRMLARWLHEHCRPDQLLAVRTRLGAVPMHQGLDAAQQAALAALELPLPSARLRLDPASPLAPLVASVLAEEGLRLEQMKLRGFREPFFSRGDRAALCLPRDLLTTSGADELNAGRRKLVLAFALPRGSYATIVVKRVTAARGPLGGADPSVPEDAHDEAAPE